MAERRPLPHINFDNAPPPYDEFEGEQADRSAYFYFADADRNPFRPDARGFELINAWWLCEAATLVYSAPALAERVLRNKTTLRQFRAFAAGGGTECFVASNDDFAIVAFRGSELRTREGRPRDFSEVFNDWRRNADIRRSNSVPGAVVHRGFADGAKEVWEAGLGDYIASLPSRKVWFTGHSLGGALATLAAARALNDRGRLDGLYTFGSPRVGDADFADSFRGMMAERGLTYYRFVNGEDVVATVPHLSKVQLSLRPVVRFKHAGTLKYIDRGGRITEDPTQLDQLKARVLALLPVDDGGHLDRRFLDGIPNAVGDHVPTFYSTHIWNAYVEEQGGG
jgi:hypothetical protein